MKKEQLEALIADYLNGEITSQQKEELRDILQQNGFDLNELTDLEILFSQLVNFEVPEPGEKMDNGFYAMLEEYKTKEQKSKQKREKAVSLFGSFFPQKYIPQMAYSLLLLMIGWAVGAWITPGSNYKSQMIEMTSEIKEMREMMMLTMIDKPSATERIKAVNLTSNFETVDDKIVHALLKTLNNDSNENVRLVTVEALYEFADNPKVRQGLIQSISKQESPLVQIALADIMISLQEKKSVEQFNKLLKKKDLNDTVRHRLEQTLAVLM